MVRVGASLLLVLDYELSAERCRYSDLDRVQRPLLDEQGPALSCPATGCVAHGSIFASEGRHGQARPAS